MAWDPDKGNFVEDSSNGRETKQPDRADATRKEAMTVDEVREAVALIATMTHDDEAAHSNEDTLWENVLRAIADGVPHPEALAKEALKTVNLDFSRWCA